MATWLSSAGKRTTSVTSWGRERGEVWHVGCYSVDVPSLSSSFTSGQDYGARGDALSGGRRGGRYINENEILS